MKLIKKKFKTNDKSVRFHKDVENLTQIIYQIISEYFEDDRADELTLDPVFNAILEKDGLASQPTLSRFFNRMDEDTLLQFDDIDKSLKDIIYSIKRPEHVLLVLGSTLFGTYGHQEGEGFYFHYQAHGYHPLLCYNGLTGDLLKADLRDGTLHCSNNADKFMEPLFQEYPERGIKTYLRGDSGFSSSMLGISVTTISRLLNKAREDKIVEFVIRDPYIECIRLEEQLRNRFHLKDIIIAPVISNDEGSESEMAEENAKKLVAMEGAHYLQRVVKESDILGVTWGSTVYHMINYLNPSQTANTVLSALKGRLVDVLILDSNLAEALLKLSEDMPSQE